jgi:hypothetical protein
MKGLRRLIIEPTQWGCNRTTLMSELGQTRPSELRLHEGSSTPSSRTHAAVWQLNPHERTPELRS